MGSGRSVCRIQLLLLAFLQVLSSLICQADGSPLEVMSAPNILRVGTAENIFVEIQDCAVQSVHVEITVKNFPTKTRRLAFTTVTLTNKNNYQAFGNITIPADDFNKNPNMKQYVYLQAAFPDRDLEKIVLVSFQSGYIFIQTDKSLYTPNSNVFYRLFAVTPGMQPVGIDANIDTSVAIDILTPDGIIVQSDISKLQSGIFPGNYQLPEIVSFGLWKVVAKFPNNPQQSFTAEFEVKEYVLPSFEVKLSPVSSYFYMDSQQLTINIKATYLFGEKVDGTAYVVFGVIQQGKKSSFPKSLQRVPIVKGNGAVILMKEHITDIFTDITVLDGSSIYVAVSVLTESGSEMVEAQLRDIQIVKSPYTISFKKTAKYFKPVVSFEVVIEVLYPDDSPAKQVQVVVNPGKKPGQTDVNGIARVFVSAQGLNENFTITAKTNDPSISPERQTSANMIAHPFTTKGNNYIHIGIHTGELKFGQSLTIDINLYGRENKQTDITYLILSRGQLVKYGRYKVRTEFLISLPETITREMMPSFRVIAYYHTNANEVVSDSVWVDVQDTCLGSLKLEAVNNYFSYNPRGMLNLKITGYPGAKVGLVAVDKGIYVLKNKHRLTQKKVWDIVEKYDTGCTPGGGKDSMNVFYDAGLLFETNTASGTPSRTDFECHTPSRKKRETTIMEVRTSLVSQYKDKLQSECCLDGLREVPVSYTCERRSEYIVDGPDCVAAFLHCCTEMERQQAQRKKDILILARSEKDTGYKDSYDITSRTNFPESWLWSDITLSACPAETPKCESTSLVKEVSLPDSITTWKFIGISLSSTRGICVAKPFEVPVRKQFFIDLRLPYSAVRGEQLEIKAILHNYNHKTITVRVALKEVDDVCNAAYKKGWHYQEVKVGAQTTRSVPFIIIPMKDGELPIEVKATVKNSDLNDGITKKLRVVPEGELMRIPKTVTLDPARKGDADGVQVEIINSQISLEDAVPNSPMNTQIFMTGREQISFLMENGISGKSMGTLIRQPGGCGEQNMAAMTLPVIAATYLDKTNQWEAVGTDKRDKALKHIETGYTTQAAYRKEDGSFAVFRFWVKGSTWLTAYVAKVFSMANNLVAVQSNMICDAIKFLILKTQQPNGLFKEVGYVYDRAMRSDVLGTDSHASMTAFCLIAMQESREICKNTVMSLPGSINKAVAYLERHLPSLTNSYAVAMTSNALANQNKLNQDILYNFASQDGSHWPVRDERIHTLEATAYALLALIKAKAFEKAKPIVRWLNQQQKVDGGYGSTQATIMVYQAVAEYWANAEEPEYNLDVDVFFPGRSMAQLYKLNKGNPYTTITFKFKHINKDVKVRANGTGEATFKMVSLFYALPKERESNCEMFNLTVQLLPVKIGEDEKIYKLKIKVFFKDKERNTTMSILDIGLLTGFTFNKNDLESLSKGHASSISKYEMDTFLSEKGSLIIYLKTISNVQPEEISFRIHQDMKVGVLQPAAVSVYEYNNQKRCLKFYHPERRDGELLTLCGNNNECRCAEEKCSLQKNKNIEDGERLSKACEITDEGKIDFVYKVEVEDIKDELSTDIYKMRIITVLKEGTTDVGPEDKVRAFLSYQYCREALNLRKNNTYLIMGTSRDIRLNPRNQLYEYILGERTWIEYWPTDTECQNDHRMSCLGINELKNVHSKFGCPL
ncbi:complement C3-like [Brachyistius frenatus]|uniref:complement C3-like n=1 Tax=Brachyistius frenatus TaxID=100188 RepID=UPI0037E70F5C